MEDWNTTLMDIDFGSSYIGREMPWVPMIPQDDESWYSPFPEFDRSRTMGALSKSSTPSRILLRRLEIWGLKEDNRYHHDLFKLNWLLNHDFDDPKAKETFLSDLALPLYCEVLLKHGSNRFFSTALRSHFQHLCQRLENRPVATFLWPDCMKNANNGVISQADSLLTASRNTLLLLLHGNELPRSLQEVISVLMLAHAALTVLLPSTKYALEALENAHEVLDGTVNSELLNVCFYKVFMNDIRRHTPNGRRSFAAPVEASDAAKYPSIDNSVPEKGCSLQNIHDLRHGLRESFLEDLGLWRNLLTSKVDQDAFDMITFYLWDTISPHGDNSCHGNSDGPNSTMEQLSRLPQLISIASSVFSNGADFDRAIWSSKNLFPPEGIQCRKRSLNEIPTEPPMHYTSESAEVEDGSFLCDGNRQGSIEGVLQKIMIDDDHHNPRLANVNDENHDWGDEYYRLFWIVVKSLAVCLITLLFLVTHGISMFRLTEEYKTDESYQIVSTYIFSPLKEDAIAKPYVYKALEDAHESFRKGGFQPVTEVSKVILRDIANVMSIASIADYVALKTKIIEGVKHYQNTPRPIAKIFCKSVFEIYFQMYDRSDGFRLGDLGKIYDETIAKVNPGSKVSKNNRIAALLGGLEYGGAEDPIRILAETWGLQQSTFSQPSNQDLKEALLLEIEDHSFLIDKVYSTPGLDSLPEVETGSNFDFLLLLSEASSSMGLSKSGARSSFPSAGSMATSEETTFEETTISPSSENFTSPVLTLSEIKLDSRIEPTATNDAEGSLKSAASKPFSCPTCDKRFTNIHNMKRHVKNIHKAEGRGSCIACGEEFSRADYILKPSGHQKRCTRSRLHVFRSIS